MSTADKRPKAIRKAKAELEAEARARQEAEQEKRKKKAEARGKKYRPRNDPEQARPRPRDQRNFTDPESRIMRDSDKAFIQGYNGQAAVMVTTSD